MKTDTAAGKSWKIKFKGFASLCSRCAEAYNRCDISQAASSLAYSVLMTIFPMLMCINYLIGLFHIDMEQLLYSREISYLIPSEVMEILEMYLEFASTDISAAVLLIAVWTILTSSSNCVRVLLRAMDKLYNKPEPPGLSRTILSFVLSGLLLFTICLSIIVIFTGSWFFQAMESLLPVEILELLPLETIQEFWKWIKYLILFCMEMLLVYFIYRAGTPVKMRGRRMILSSVLSSVATVAFSGAFAWFIGFSSRYALLYGSLASIIVFLLWLYFCGNLILSGAILLSRMEDRENREEGGKEPDDKRRSWNLEEKIEETISKRLKGSGIKPLH